MFRSYSTVTNDLYTIVLHIFVLAVAPQIVTPRSLFGGLAESDVVLECMVEASPISVNYWIKGSVPKRNSYETFTRPEMLLDG